MRETERVKWYQVRLRLRLPIGFSVCETLNGYDKREPITDGLSDMFNMENSASSYVASSSGAYGRPKIQFPGAVDNSTLCPQVVTWNPMAHLAHLSQRLLSWTLVDSTARTTNNTPKLVRSLIVCFPTTQSQLISLGGAIWP